MPTSVTMPQLGESVTEGTVTRWLKAEGDHVDADEPLLEVSTDKVDTEVPSPASGTLVSIKVQEDETVDVGAELAVIGDGGDDAGGGGDVAADHTRAGGAGLPVWRAAVAGADQGRPAEGGEGGAEEEKDRRAGPPCGSQSAATAARVR